MSHSIQSQSYLVPRVHSEGNDRIGGVRAYDCILGYVPMAMGLLFGAKDHLTLHSLYGYRYRTEWLLSSAVNSSRNVIFALLNHASLHRCKILQLEA